MMQKYKLPDPNK